MGDLIGLLAVIVVISKVIQSFSKKKAGQDTPKPAKPFASPQAANETPAVPPHAFGEVLPEPPQTAAAAQQKLSRAEIDQLKGVLRERMRQRNVQGSTPSAGAPVIRPSITADRSFMQQAEGRAAEHPASSLSEGISADYQFGRQRVGSSGNAQVMSGFTEGESPERRSVLRETEAAFTQKPGQSFAQPLFSGRDGWMRAVVLSEVLGPPVSRRSKTINGGQPWRNR